MEAGYKKKDLYNRVKNQQSFENNNGRIIPGLTKDAGDYINQTLGNDHKSRLNLLLSHYPLSQIDQAEVDNIIAENVRNRR